MQRRGRAGSWNGFLIRSHEDIGRRCLLGFTHPHYNGSHSAGSGHFLSWYRDWSECAVLFFGLTGRFDPCHNKASRFLRKDQRRCSLLSAPVLHFSTFYTKTSFTDSYSAHMSNTHTHTHTEPWALSLSRQSISTYLLWRVFVQGSQPLCDVVNVTCTGSIFCAHF